MTTSSNLCSSNVCSSNLNHLKRATEETPAIKMNNKPKQIDAQASNQKRTFNLSTKIDKSDKLTNLPSTLNSNRNKISSNSVITNHKTTTPNFVSLQPSSLQPSSSVHSFANSTVNSTHSTHSSIAIKSNPKLNQTSKSTASNDYPCQLCELNFYDIERLNFHLIKIHKIDKRINLIGCYVNGCEEKFKKRMELVRHLNLDHNLKIVVFTNLVNSLDEFIKWKDKVEKETGYKWIQNNKFFLNNRLRKTYICNRSASNGSKLYSLHGLATINSHSTFCLSSIKVTENDNGQFLIEFIETHNHDE